MRSWRKGDRLPGRSGLPSGSPRSAVSRWRICPEPAHLCAANHDHVVATRFENLAERHFHGERFGCGRGKLRDGLVAAIAGEVGLHQFVVDRGCNSTAPSAGSGATYGSIAATGGVAAFSTGPEAMGGGDVGAGAALKCPRDQLTQRDHGNEDRGDERAVAHRRVRVFERQIVVADDLGRIAIVFMAAVFKAARLPKWDIS